MKKVLRADGALYLVRYTLLWTKWLKIRLHHILLSDTECLHDHPWDFVSVILKGGYYETRERDTYVTAITSWKPFTEKRIFEKVKKWISPGSIIRRKAEDKHRLELPVGRSCWTLVFMFKRRREWGFWRLGKFIHHRDYDMKQTCE